MPCYMAPGSYGLECYDETGNCTKRIKDQLDQLTRLLCEANTLIDDRDCLGWETHTPRSKELTEWWKAHQQWDRKRKR